MEKIILNKLLKILKSKELQLLKVIKLQDDYNNGITKYSIDDLDKNEIEIKAQISILRHLLSE